LGDFQHQFVRFSAECLAIFSIVFLHIFTELGVVNLECVVKKTTFVAKSFVLFINESK